MTRAPLLAARLCTRGPHACQLLSRLFFGNSREGSRAAARKLPPPCVSPVQWYGTALTVCSSGSVPLEVVQGVAKAYHAFSCRAKSVKFTRKASSRRGHAQRNVATRN
eukprot:649618-Pleurochrysis_carterae.AAC.1